VLYNGQIYPIVKMAIRGVNWYQGEQNVGNATNYACRFPAMITAWRRAFNNYNIYFNFVLLAAYKEGGNPAWPNIRAAQMAALQLPYVGVASAQDLGDETGPNGAIHPRNKTFVGDRLAYNVMNEVYGLKDVVNVGPRLTDVIWPVKGPVQTVIMRFSSDLLNNQGLILRDTSECSMCCHDSAGSAVTVGTSDGQTRRTTVIVDPTAYLVLATVDLSKTPTVEVTSVQHNWEAYAECSLYNSGNIPMLPINATRI